MMNLGIFVLMIYLTSTGMLLLTFYLKKQFTEILETRSDFLIQKAKVLYSGYFIAALAVYIL